MLHSIRWSHNHLLASLPCVGCCSSLHCIFAAVMTCRPVERNALITQGGCGGLEGGSAEPGAAAAAGSDDHPRARLHKQLAEKRKKRSKARPAAAAASAAAVEDGYAVAGGTDSVMSAQTAGGEAGEGACSGGSAAGDSVASLPVTAPAGDSKRHRERCKGGGGGGDKGGVRAGSVGSQPRSAVASAQKKMVLRAKVRVAFSAANGSCSHLPPFAPVCNTWHHQAAALLCWLYLALLLSALLQHEDSS